MAVLDKFLRCKELVSYIQTDNISRSILQWNGLADGNNPAGIRDYTRLSYVLKVYDYITSELEEPIRFKGELYINRDHWKPVFGTLLADVQHNVMNSFSSRSSNDPDRILLRLKLLLDRISIQSNEIYDLKLISDIRELCLEYIRICILSVSNGWGLTKEIVDTLNDIDEYCTFAEQLILEQSLKEND